MNRRKHQWTWQRSALTAALLAAHAWGAAAQTPPARAGSLKQAYEAAWERQPEAQALAERRKAALAQQQAAQAWTPEPAALEVAAKTDRFQHNGGAREYTIGVAIPLWLPDERMRAGELAQAEATATQARSSAAQLRLAASVREAWWAWQRARIERDIATQQHGAAQRIASDVARRVRAGDLARSDQHQSDGAVATAELAQAQAEAAESAASLLLKGLTGLLPDAPPSPEAEPEAHQPLDRHAAVQDLDLRAQVAERTAALAAAQTRANPELTLGTTRDRGGFGEPYGPSIHIGLRIPLGGGPRHEGRIATARAEAAELHAQAAQEHARLQAELEAAQARADAAKRQVAAAERRARLASEARGFFDKSFRLGETDLPTRLRIEAEASEAERQAARARVELAASVSAWRQSLGWLP